jgi:C1A family cysteine protease
MKAAALFLAAAVGLCNGWGDKSWDKEFTFHDLEGNNKAHMFSDWMIDNHRNYKDLEEQAYRYGIWMEKLDEVAQVNSADLTYKFRLNQFSDLTHDEMLLEIHGHTGSCLQVPPLEDLVEPNDNDIQYDFPEVPTSVDWTAAGDVTPVKNQGSCGSCWAFSSTGALECDHAVKKGTLTSLSEQQLVDCTRSYGNYGCNGGWWYNAFDYVKAEGGLCSETEYPYTAKDGSCKDKTCGTKYDLISGQVKVTADSDSALAAAAAVGCVSVGVDAAFGSYSSGVYTGSCGTSINHGVLVTGYGTSNGQQYWRVKNSWGASWGDNGYILICRNCGKNGSRGECGINMYPYYTTPQ